MHLSLLSDAYLSDTLADSGPAAIDAGRAGRAHRETLIRGLVVMAVFAVLMGLTCLCGTIPCAEAAKMHASDMNAERPVTAIKLSHRIVIP